MSSIFKSEQRIAAFGTWKSPLSAESVASQTNASGRENLLIDPVSSEVYFVDRRPLQNGRSAIVKASDGCDIFGLEWDARTGVHEYGGAAAIAHDGLIYFSHFKDGRVYKCDGRAVPIAVTPENTFWRYACFTVHPIYPHFIVCTLEDHTKSHPAEVKTTLCLINVKTRSVSTLIEGADFYAHATFSPDGNLIAWQQWNHPDLPWIRAEIAMASCIKSEDGNDLRVGPVIHVAGENRDLVAMEPHWTSNDQLIFLSDISGYLNPWKYDFDPSDSMKSGTASAIVLQPIEEEFGEPQWRLNTRSSAALSTNKALFTSFRKNRSILYLVDTVKSDLQEISTNYVHIELLQSDGKGHVILLGRSADSLPVVVRISLTENSELNLHLIDEPPLSEMPIPKSYISVAEHLVLHLQPDNRPCYVEFYPPKNPNHISGLPNERPPAIFWVHGGPHGFSRPSLEWMKQFFTTRGWAWVDINYGGSTGFGRKYRESLDGKWGVLDVEDTCESVVELDKLGLIDGKRAVVHGRSAGGYTTLSIAVSKPHAFAAGSPWFGVSDMRKLDEILHKFEYNLCDRLMGGKYEDIPEVWHERSPIYHARKIKMPLLILQGDLDTVVPADQMIDMANTIKDAGGKAEIIIFKGEGHGWRKAETEVRALEEELRFWMDVLNLKEDHEDN